MYGWIFTIYNRLTAAAFRGSYREVSEGRKGLMEFCSTSKQTINKCSRKPSDAAAY